MDTVTSAPTSAPASAPASAPSAAPSTPSTPAGSSSPTSQPASYGTVPRSATQRIFDEIDAKSAAPADGSSNEPSNDQPAEIQAAAPTGTTPQTPEAQTAPPEAPATEGAETLPPTLTKALAAITDQGVARYLRDAAFMRKTLQQSGMPWDAVKQIVQDAPEIYRMAPTLDVLRGLYASAQNVDALGNAFMSGAPEGHAEFTNTLLSANPENFVGYFRSLVMGSDDLVQNIRQQYGEQHAQAISGVLEEYVDSRLRNVLARYRARATKEGEEAWGEVADMLEGDLQLKLPDGPPQQARPDPRDIELQRLRAENRARVEAQEQAFMTSATTEARTRIESHLKGMLDKLASGFPPKARDKVTGEILTSLKDELNSNPGVRARINQINASGKRDQSHAAALTNEMVECAKRILGTIGPRILREKAEEIGLGLEVRKQRVAAQVARRDAGSSGLPSTPRAPALPANASPKDLFRHLDLQAGDKPLA